MHRLLIVLVAVTLLTSACARRIPEPAGVAPGTPYVSWVVMSGDRDNPDQDFVCQSTPRNECVVPVSRADAQIFSNVYLYYHGAGAETKYQGSIQIGFFRGSTESSRSIQTNATVRKTGSIANQSVTGIVTDTPGTYAIAFSLVATTDTGRSQPIQEQVPVVVK